MIAADRAGAPDGRRAMRRWLLVTMPSAPSSSPTRSPNTSRSISAPTTTRTARSTGCSPGSTALMSPPGSARARRCCSSGPYARGRTKSLATWAEGCRCSGTSSTSSGCSCSPRSGCCSRARGRSMRYQFLLPPAAAAVTALLCLPDRPTAAARGPAGRGEQVAEPDGSLGATSTPPVRVVPRRPTGRASSDRGPPLTEEGPAAVDFVLRTGRMPLAAPNMQASGDPCATRRRRSSPSSSTPARSATGPTIPDVDAAAGDLAAGGELYRFNCAACHVTSGAGAAIGGGREAPSLMESSPTEIGQAILVGPGAMPTFQSFTARTSTTSPPTSIDLQRSDTTAVDEFGGAGPVAEGLAAWLLGAHPADRPDPLDRHATRGPRHARRRRARREQRGGAVTELPRSCLAGEPAGLSGRGRLLRRRRRRGHHGRHRVRHRTHRQPARPRARRSPSPVSASA